MNGLSVLELLESYDGKKKEYSQIIAENFNNPLLSFKGTSCQYLCCSFVLLKVKNFCIFIFHVFVLFASDDKPAIAVTHGDLLPLSDRVRVRTYLGELLGVPPTTQIFDIPGST